MIKRLYVENFKGIERLETEFSPKMALIAPNGTGKTSFIEALRWVLTGNEPEEIIRRGADCTTVKVILDDGTEIIRSKKEGKTTFKMNGRTTTAKALNETLVSSLGVTKETLSLLTSSDAVKSMGKDELGDFILSQVSEKVSIEDIQKMLPEVNKDENEEFIKDNIETVLEELFPEKDFTSQDIDAAYDKAFQKRKELKVEVTALSAVTKEEVPMPSRPAADIEKAMAGLRSMQATLKIEAGKLAEIKRTTAQIEEYSKKIEESEKSLADLTGGAEIAPPSSARQELLEKNLSEKESATLKAKNGLAVMENNLATLQKTLDDLASSCCPLSPLITCGTDKTSAKFEIEASIDETKDGINSQKELISDFEAEISEIKEGLKKLAEEKQTYEKVSLIKKQILQMKETKAKLESSMPVLSGEEVALDEEDILEQLDILGKEYSAALSYDNYVKTLRGIAPKKAEIALYDYFVKALAPKGEVKTKLLGKYLTPIEEAMNEVATTYSKAMTVRLVPDDGIVYEVSVNGGDFRPFVSLSGGEKIRALLLMIGVLGQLTGFPVFVIDEIGEVDEATIPEVVSAINSYSSCYEHLIVASPLYTVTENAVKAEGFDVVKL